MSNKIFSIAGHNTWLELYEDIRDKIKDDTILISFSRNENKDHRLDPRSESITLAQIKADAFEEVYSNLPTKAQINDLLRLMSSYPYDISRFDWILKLPMKK